MGRLLDDLERQLKNTEFKKDAEECIEIYNWIKSTDNEGRVWSSRWEPLTTVKFIGPYPAKKIYSLNFVGKAVLEKIRI